MALISPSATTGKYLQNKRKHVRKRPNVPRKRLTAAGAKAAAPATPVIALCGDGGFLLNVGELATAVQEQLNVVVVVFNDATYTAVKAQQARRYNRRFIATDLVPPDYIALARAFGLNATKATTPAALHDAIAEAIQHNGSTLIEVPLPKAQW